MNLVSPESRPEDSADVPVLDCLATRDPDGTVYLSIVNKSPYEDIDAGIVFTGHMDPERKAEMKTIFHEDLKASNTLEHPDTVAISDADAPVFRDGTLCARFPRHSVSLIIIRP